MPIKLPILTSTPPRLTAERLFREQFLPLYPPGASLEVIRRTDANPAKNPAIVAAAEETAALFARLAPEALRREDLALDFSDASVHRLSAALTTEARDSLFAAKRAPGEPPLFVHFVLHGTLYVAACIVKNHGGRWLFRSPLWETRVALGSRAGDAELAPLSWWLAAFSDDGVGRLALSDRYRTLVEVPCEDVEAWPVVFDAARRRPRLSRPHYHAWVQYKETHLPEIEDLGPDFPTAERFTELELRYLDARVVGGGRRVVVFGPGKSGFHVFWLDRSGFSKAAFVEADAAPEPKLTVGASARGDETLLLSFGRGGAPVTVEWLWWGP